MGLTTWKNAPKSRICIRKNDVWVAKNYLNKKELEGLNRIVSMYLDYAESQALKGILMNMEDWVNKLDAFLKFNEEVILKDADSVSHEVALSLAESEFEKYNQGEDALYESDFEREVKMKKLEAKRTKK